MIKTASLTDEEAPLTKCKMSLGNSSAGFRPRSFFSSGGFVDGTDEGRQLSRLSGGPLDQERVTSLDSTPAATIKAAN
jgi:hypothetical protein